MRNGEVFPAFPDRGVINYFEYSRNQEKYNEFGFRSTPLEAFFNISIFFFFFFEGKQGEEGVTKDINIFFRNTALWVMKGERGRGREGEIWGRGSFI